MVTQNQLINLIKEHLIPWPKGADATLWNERVGILLEDILTLFEDNQGS